MDEVLVSTRHLVVIGTNHQRDQTSKLYPPPIVPGQASKYLSDQYETIFDPSCVHALRRLVRGSGADIVVCSTWRGMGIDRFREMWEYRKCPGTILDVTPNLLGASRGCEIDAWLEQNDPFTPYVIVDDSEDYFPYHRSRHVCPKPWNGLSMREAVDALDILAQQNVDVRYR